MISAALRLTTAATVIAVALTAVSASAAGKPFLRFKFDTVFTTKIDATGSASKLPDRIEVDSWHWGATGARVGGKMHLEDISLGVAPQAGAKGGNVEFEWKVEEGESAPPPPPRGSLSIKVPAGTCKAGKRYPAAEFGTDRRVYQLTGVVVTRCGAAASAGRPMESLSLNYTKVVYRTVE